MFRDPELTLAKAMNMGKVVELSQSQLKQIATTTAEDTVHYTKNNRQIVKAHKEKKANVSTVVQFINSPSLNAQHMVKPAQSARS